MSSERVDAIEKKIDRSVAGAIELYGSPAGATTIAPKNLTDVMEFAKMMAVSGPCVRPAFRGSPGACLAIALQAFRTGADPFAVANKAYITTSRSGDEQIAYEAQYIHAVLNNSGKLSRRLRATYSGVGPKRRCKIIGHVVGEEEPLEYESPTIEEIAVKNSPLWKGDPDQQLFYYSTRAWGRRHLPEVLLGMYTPDEIRGDVIDITPGPTQERPRPEDYATQAQTEQADEEPGQIEREESRFAAIDLFGEAREFSTEVESLEALAGWIGETRSVRALDGLMESNSTLAQYPVIIEAYKDQKEALTDPGTREDRPATDAPPPDPARGAAAIESPPAGSAGTAGERPAHVGSGPAATAHPEERQSSTTAERRSPPNTPGEAALRGASKPVAHAPRDENFWSQEKYLLPETKTAKETLYYLQKYLGQCRDQFDVNGIETDNAGRLQEELSGNARKEAEQMIGQRRKELPA